MKHIRKDRRRRGFLTMELALTLPIFAIILFSIFEFSLLFNARGKVVEAARVGARAATLPGATEFTVEDEVLAVMPASLGNGAEVYIELADNPGEPVLVSVRVPMNNAAPDLLWLIGYSIADRYLIADSRMVRE